MSSITVKLRNKARLADEILEKLLSLESFKDKDKILFAEWVDDKVAETFYNE